MPTSLRDIFENHFRHFRLGGRYIKKSLHCEIVIFTPAFRSLEVTHIMQDTLYNIQVYHVAIAYHNLLTDFSDIFTLMNSWNKKHLKRLVEDYI